VTLSFLISKQISVTDGRAYIAAQVIGGVLGVVVAHLMFGLPLIQDSTIVRTGLGQYVGEFVATFGLLATILGCLRFRADAVPYAVGLYITSAYWFTSSTSFANPAVTIARGLSDTFAGIQMVDVPMFIVMQLVGAMVATMVFGWLLKGDD